MVWAIFPVRSPLLRESSFLSFPEGTKMFQFPSLPTTRLCIHRGLTRLYPGRVSASKRSPDQSLLNGSPRLIAAMPRLSSALNAYASTLDAYLLDSCFALVLFDYTSCLILNELRQQPRSRPSIPVQGLVEATGLEPVTSGLQSQRSPS